MLEQILGSRRTTAMQGGAAFVEKVANTIFLHRG